MAFCFGPEYILPKPLDPRLIEYLPLAVAQAAMRTGVARVSLDLEAYRESLRQRMANARKRMETLVAGYGW